MDITANGMVGVAVAAAVFTHTINFMVGEILKRRVEWVEDLADYARREFSKLDSDHDKIVTKSDLRAFLAQKGLPYNDKIYGEAILANLKHFGKVIERRTRKLPFTGPLAFLPQRCIVGFTFNDLAAGESQSRKKLKIWRGEKA